MHARPLPIGSTDALAYSLHGTRCAATAALHIALGDRIPLDVLELHAQQGTWGGGVYISFALGVLRLVLRCGFEHTLLFLQTIFPIARKRICMHVYVFLLLFIF